MKNTFILAACMIFLCLLSCTKDHSGPKPPTLGTLKIDLSFPDNSKALGNVEVIINEPAGKVLLDTGIAVNTNLSATLQTNATLVDFTTITYHQGYQYPYWVNTYRGVDPTTWSSLQSMDWGNLFRPVPRLGGSTQNKIVYTNPPAVTDPTQLQYLQMSDYVPSPASTQDNAPGGTIYQPGISLDVTYYNHNNNSVYLLFPELGLYDLHPWHSANDTVDLTHMDTAVRLTYAKPAQTYTSITQLVGFLDTTDLTKNVSLYIGPFTYPWDLEYPAKGIQAYELLALFFNQSNESFMFYFYGTGVPTTMPFPASPSYTIQANLQDSFTVQFPGPRPSNYSMSWVGANTTYTVYSSPDSTVLHPETLLNRLKSKMLQGQSFSSLKAQSFDWERFPGLDYAGTYIYFFNPPLWSKIRLSGATSVGRGF